MRVGHRAALPTGDVNPAPPEEEAQEGEATVTLTLYVPSDHTVAEVIDYVSEHPDQLDSIYAAEEAGKNRSTLLSGLDAMR